MKTAILDEYQTPMVILNNAGEITYANQAFVENSGYSRTELSRANAKSIMINLDSILNNQNAQTYLKKKNGEEIPYWVEASHFKNKNQIGLIFSDIKMHGLDPLTRLPNRYIFTRHLQSAIDKAKEMNAIIAVFFIDLDRFKFINDTLGHTYGDLLLKEVSVRLKNCSGLGNMVARMGGDEFICLARDLQHESDVDIRAEKILSAFQKPFQLKETEIYITPSIGISLYPYDGDEMDTLITNADTAMYRAKRSGHCKIEKARVDISAGMYEKLMIENSLRSALANEELHLHFQPQIDIRQNKIIGMEALLRWNHPDIGNIPPAEFIPIAEETGLILPIGDWVIKNACKKIKEWLDAGNQNVKVAVNISAKQFLQNDFADKIQHVLEEFCIPSDCLELEITESMMIYDIDSATDILHRLKRLGVQITVDDFGKGYSSLQYLQTLPIDTLKIDRSFIVDIDTNPSSKALTNAIANLAHALNMKVVAEGVESEIQLRHVQTLECDGVQGFYYSKPLSPEAADSYFKQLPRRLESCLTY